MMAEATEQDQESVMEAGAHHGALDECEPVWLGAFLTGLRISLVKAGIGEFPVPSYFLKSEWPKTKATSGPLQAG